MFGEEGRQLVERDKLNLVVKIHVARAGNAVEFLRFGRELVCVFAEIPRISLLTSDELDGRGEIVSICANGKQFISAPLLVSDIAVVERGGGPGAHGSNHRTRGLLRENPS